VDGVHCVEKSGVLWSFVKAMGIDMDMLLLEDEDELPMSMLDISWFILGGFVLGCYDRLCSRSCRSRVLDCMPGRV
jgi:hypothetical protein